MSPPGLCSGTGPLARAQVALAWEMSKDGKDFSRESNDHVPTNVLCSPLLKLKTAVSLPVLATKSS